MAWPEDKKKQVIEKYLAAEPTPANSMEICKELAEEFEETANGVRMVLMQAGVYVKKDATAAASTGSAAGKKSSEGSKRVSKEDSINALKEAIEAKGKTVDDEILSKLTGKAAVYLLSVVQD